MEIEDRRKRLKRSNEIVTVASRRNSSWKRHGKLTFDQGSFGKVSIFTRRDADVKEFFAGKQVSKDKYRKEETEILYTLSHVNVVKLYSVEFHRKENEYLIIMELCHMSLQNALEGDKKLLEFPRSTESTESTKNTKLPRFIMCPRLTESEIKIILLELLDAVEYLGEMNIMHRDIKPGNILLQKRNDTQHPYIAKICDFGQAKEWVDEKNTTGQGTEWYAAPEVMAGSAKYDTKCDIYSLGATYMDIAILATGDCNIKKKYYRLYNQWGKRIPVDKPKDMQLLKELVSKKFKPIWNIAVKMLRFNPSRRPTLSACKEKIQKFLVVDSEEPFENSMNPQDELGNSMQMEDSKSPSKDSSEKVTLCRNIFQSLDINEKKQLFKSLDKNQREMIRSAIENELSDEEDVRTTEKRTRD